MFIHVIIFNFKILLLRKMQQKFPRKMADPDSVEVES